MELFRQWNELGQGQAEVHNGVERDDGREQDEPLRRQDTFGQHDPTGRARHGEVVQVWDGLRGMTVMGEICDPVHFDKENKRLHA